MPTSPLRQCRQAAGLSLRQLGHRAGISYSQLSRFEHGLAAPTTTLIRIAAALGCDPADLQTKEAGDGQ